MNSDLLPQLVRGLREGGVLARTAWETGRLSRDEWRELRRQVASANAAATQLALLAERAEPMSEDEGKTLLREVIAGLGR